MSKLLQGLYTWSGKHSTSNWKIIPALQFWNMIIATPSALATLILGIALWTFVDISNFDLSSAVEHLELMFL